MDNQNIICLTLQYNFNDITSIEAFLADRETRDSTERCLPIALRNVMNEEHEMYKNYKLAPIGVPNAYTTLLYLEPLLMKDVRMAIHRNLPHAVQYLLSQGVDFFSDSDRAQRRNDISALRRAIEDGSPEMVWILMYYMTTKGKVYKGFFNSLIIPAAARGNTEIIRYLVHFGANIDYGDGTVVEVAAKSGHTEALKLILSYPGMSKYFDSALTYAAKGGHYDTVKALMDFANTTLRGEILSLGMNKIGERAILAAAEKGHLNVVKLLMDLGINVHAANDAALIKAAKYGHDKIVRFLLDDRADVHTGEDRALHLAAESGHTSTVELLLSRGADIHADNDYALRYAASNGHTDTVKYLIGQKADTTAYRQAWKQAVVNMHHDVIGLLLNEMIRRGIPY